LVAGSSPAGATKFHYKKHKVKPLIEAVFLYLAFRVAAKWRCIFLNSLIMPLLIALSRCNKTTKQSKKPQKYVK
jgi:hypothetical protein